MLIQSKVVFSDVYRKVKRLKALTRFGLIILLFSMLGSVQVAGGRSNLPTWQVETTTQDQVSLRLALLPFATGLNSPVGVIGSDDGRLYVLERAGAIRTLLPDGSIVPEPFLDISERVDASFVEEGLLGLALHPNFAANGHFYVNYINTSNGVRRTRISRFSLSDAANTADPNSEEILMTVEQPYDNHNGGHIMFGPDGFLYIPLGDGGGGGDPGNRAQDVTTLLGKVARIDIDSNSLAPADCIGLGSGNYTVPADNPLIDGFGGACDEIWDLGLRNPWRSSFDRELGDLYLGDVGQNSWEEVDLHPAAAPPAQNFGWRCYEGNHAFNTKGCGPAQSYRMPIFEYSQEGNGCAITAGYIYRGRRYPEIYGHFFLTDYCSGNFWELIPDGSGSWNSIKHTNLRAFGYVAFGEGCDGELYLANIDKGSIYRLGTESESTTPSNPRVIGGNVPGALQMESWLYLPLIMTNHCL